MGAFVRLVPSEYSSGASRTLGPITKTGNGHTRRLLVEAAWHHRPRYRVGAVMQARWDQAPAAARARGDAGNRRLHDRWVGFLERRKRPTIANVAIVRELAGWCWSLAVVPIRASRRTADRYEHDYPGSLVHIDVKKVGVITRSALLVV
ncbi:transposase [Agromyces sp. ISL-38]|uniref:transposase n=1 Tax=Agromyces sp. ISL-38 TaxID=2819107 RepID=UPI0035AB70C7